MTDKVQKIRNEVERIQLYTQSEVLKQVLDYIDEVQKEPISEDLEYASEKYACRFSSSKYGRDKIKATFKIGAQWQKEQMMAKAVEGGCFSYKNGFVHISCDIDEHLTDIKIGDKVKVIVIKED